MGGVQDVSLPDIVGNASPVFTTARYGSEKFKCGEDDKGDAVKMKLRYYMRYHTDTPADDSPLYIFVSALHLRSGGAAAQLYLSRHCPPPQPTPFHLLIRHATCGPPPRAAHTPTIYGSFLPMSSFRCFCRSVAARLREKTQKGPRAGVRRGGGGSCSQL